MQDVNFVLLVSRFLHLSSAMFLVGAAALMLIGLLPAMRESLDESAAGRLRDSVSKHWGKVVHASIGLLLITGGYNFWILGMQPVADKQMSAMPYHGIFGVKFLLALVVFVIGTAMVGKSAAFEKLRADAGKWLKVLVAIALLIVLLSGLLNQVRSNQKGGEAAAPTPAVTTE